MLIRHLLYFLIYTLELPHGGAGKIKHLDLSKYSYMLNNTDLYA